MPSGQAQFDFFWPGEKPGTGTWWRTSKKTKTPRPGAQIEATFVKDVGTGRSTDEKPTKFFDYADVHKYVKDKAALVAEVHGTHQLDPKAVRTMSLTTAGKKALDDTGVPYTAATKSGLNQVHKEHTDALDFLEGAVEYQRSKSTGKPSPAKSVGTGTAEVSSENIVPGKNGSGKKSKKSPSKRMVTPTLEEAQDMAAAAEIEELTKGAVTAEELLSADAIDREEAELQQAIRESAQVAQPQRPSREGKKSASAEGGAPSRPPPPPPRRTKGPPPASESKEPDDYDEDAGPVARTASARKQKEVSRRKKSSFVEDVPSPQGEPESETRKRMGNEDGDVYQANDDLLEPATPAELRRQRAKNYRPSPSEGPSEKLGEAAERFMMSTEGAASRTMNSAAAGKNPKAPEYVPSPEVRLRVQREGTARATPNARSRRQAAQPSIGKGVGRTLGVGGILGTDSGDDSDGRTSRSSSTTTSEAGVDPVMAAALFGGAGEDAGTQTDMPDEEGTARYTGTNQEAPDRESGHMGGASQADMAKTAEGAVFPEAVKRIAKKRRQDYRVWRNSFIKEHAGRINKMDEAALLWGCTELKEQYMPTMHIRTLRYSNGASRRDLVRQYVELSVLSKLSEDDGEGSDKLALMLANNKLGLNLADLLGEGKAMKSGTASTDPYAPLKADGTKVKGGAPVGSAVDYQQETLPVIPPEKLKKELHSQGTVDTKQSVDERGEVGKILVDPGLYDVRLVDNNLSSHASVPTLKQYFDLRLNKNTEPKRFKLIL